MHKNYSGSVRFGICVAAANSVSVSKMRLTSSNDEIERLMTMYAEENGVGALAEAITAKDDVVGDGATLFHLAAVHCNVTLLDRFISVLEEAQWVDSNEALVARARAPLPDKGIFLKGIKIGESREKLRILDGQNRTPLSAVVNVCAAWPQDTKQDEDSVEKLSEEDMQYFVMKNNGEQAESKQESDVQSTSPGSRSASSSDPSVTRRAPTSGATERKASTSKKKAKSSKGK